MIGSLKLRSRTLDQVVVGVWFGLLLCGQVVLPVESRVLEWIAAAWLWIGILVVRRTVCLPLIILTCPAFMCETRRAWAWVQPVVLWLFLARILVEKRLRLRDYLVIVFAGTVVFALSWPHNAGVLLLKLRAYPAVELFHQWRAPHASWAMFPFRQAVDRALMAAVCAALVRTGGYVSSHRIFRALGGAMFLAVAAAFGAALVPWQTHHRFLGTTNYSSYGVHVFHGAGFNVNFFATLAALGVPWVFCWPNRERRGMVIGCVGALLPLLMIEQLALQLVFVGYLLLAVALVVAAIPCPTLLKRCGIRVRGLVSQWPKWGSTLFLTTLLSAAWLLCVWGRLAAKIKMQVSVIAGRGGTAVGLPGLLLVCVVLVLAFCAGRLRERCSRGAFRRLQGLAARRCALGVAVLAGVCTALCVHQVYAGRSEASIRSSKLRRSVLRVLRCDRARGPMWRMGFRATVRKPFVGHGAGTWARYQKAQRRSSSKYYAHMHNTYLDLMFEYGLVVAVALFSLCAFGVLRVAFMPGIGNRLWLFYFAGVAVIALGQHLLYAFTSMCLLLPGSVLLAGQFSVKSRGDE